MADEGAPLLLKQRLRAVVGRRHVLTGKWKTRPYRSAYRMHIGIPALVIRPGSLIELWRVLEVCVAARCAIILQAANTGLTGGSSPAAQDYGRPVVIVSVLRLRNIHLIDDGMQAICLAGSTLDELERRLRPIGREPHSVIGSSCLGASVTGGICNNSGGALVQRGPAYTELALFAHVDDGHRLQLVNHLGIALGDTPAEMLCRLERGDFAAGDIGGGGAAASDHNYRERVRDLSVTTPARFNADINRLHEASGSAGKIAVFAVRVDTFPAPTGEQTFYIGTNAPESLAALRRGALTDLPELPIAAEYLHRDAFAVAQNHGRDIYLAVRSLAPRHLTPLFRMRQMAEGIAERWLGRHASRLHAAAHGLLRRIPVHLPERLRDYRDRYAHHLILKVPQAEAARYQGLLDVMAATGELSYFTCSLREARAAFSHRFAVAGAANNFRLANRKVIAGLLTFDVALAPADPAWHHFLPEALRNKVIPVAYGHFFCHVFHLDYLVRCGEDPEAIRDTLKAWFDARNARYPAEHNFGHLYRAPDDVVAHYRALDPTNSFNPGIGRTSLAPYWIENDATGGRAASC